MNKTPITSWKVSNLTLTAITLTEGMYIDPNIHNPKSVLTQNRTSISPFLHLYQGRIQEFGRGGGGGGHC